MTVFPLSILISNLFSILYHDQDADKKKAMRNALVTDKTKLPYWFSKFESRLTENEARGSKNGYFVGDTMTVADLKAYYNIDPFVTGAWGFDGAPLLKAAPKVAAFMEKMKADENIVKFEAAFAAQQEKSKANEEDNVHVVKGKNVYAAM